jgi:hypothetical protein
LKNNAGISGEDSDQRAEQLGQSLGPDRKDGHGAEGACGGSEGCCGTGAVLGGMLEQHVGGDLPKFYTDGDDNDARNHGRKEFSHPVDQRRHRDFTGACEHHHAADRWKEFVLGDLV